MRLIIRDDPETASAYVANYIIKRINDFAPTSTRPFVLGLPTGSSPIIIYRILVEKYKAGEISFENVVTFNMDEYVGIPRDHPESYHTFMYKHLFSHINIHPTNIHIPNGTAPSLTAECAAYEAQIAQAGGIDLFLAGVGPDGHIAFNEPGSSLTSRTRVETLAPTTLSANARFFAHDPAQVPRLALTVGVQTVLDAREVVVVATGAHKASALQAGVEGGVSHMCTLSALQLHSCAMMVVDEDATLELRVKTVRYFKAVEAVAASRGSELGSSGWVGLPRRAVEDPMRSVTPELVVDNMASRLKATPVPVPVPVPVSVSSPAMLSSSEFGLRQQHMGNAVGAVGA